MHYLEGRAKYLFSQALYLIFKSGETPSLITCHRQQCCTIKTVFMIGNSQRVGTTPTAHSRDVLAHNVVMVVIMSQLRKVCI